MLDKLLLDLKNEEPEKRIDALAELEKNYKIYDKLTVISALKPLILDWDDDVRLKVAKVLKLYTGR